MLGFNEWHWCDPHDIVTQCNSMQISSLLFIAMQRNIYCDRKKYLSRHKEIFIATQRNIYREYTEMLFLCSQKNVPSGKKKIGSLWKLDALVIFMFNHGGGWKLTRKNARFCCENFSNLYLYQLNTITNPVNKFLRIVNIEDICNCDNHRWAISQIM